MLCARYLLLLPFSFLSSAIYRLIPTYAMNESPLTVQQDLLNAIRAEIPFFLVVLFSCVQQTLDTISSGLFRNKKTWNKARPNCGTILQQQQKGNKFTIGVQQFRAMYNNNSYIIYAQHFYLFFFGTIFAIVFLSKRRKKSFDLLKMLAIGQALIPICRPVLLLFSIHPSIVSLISFMSK